MQDVEKTEIQSQTSPKRRRRRNRMRPLYGLLVAALVIGVGVSLSMTVFFNIATIEIAGDAPQYTAEDIAAAADELRADVQTKVVLSTFPHDLTDDTSFLKILILDFINENVELRQIFLCQISMFLCLEKGSKQHIGKRSLRIHTRLVHFDNHDVFA